MTAKENLLRYYHHQPMEEYTPWTAGIIPMKQPCVVRDIPQGAEDGEDWFGVAWCYDKINMAFTPDTRKKPILEDICDWREVVKWPDLDALDWEEAVRKDGIDKLDRGNKLLMMYSVIGPFERLHMLMGMEEALVSLMTEPDEVLAFIDRFTEYKIDLINHMCKYYKPDVLQFHDDAGTKNATFYSPDTWRKFFKPSWTKMAEAVHANGIPVELHSCGRNTEILIDLLDTGIDSCFIQPINDIARIRSYTKGRIGMAVQLDVAYFGAAVLSKNLTVKEIREKVYQDVKELLEGGNGADYITVAPPPVVSDGATSTTAKSTYSGPIVLPGDDEYPEQRYLNVIMWDELMKHKQEFDQIVRKNGGLL